MKPDSASNLENCFSCGGQFPSDDGVVHDYMLSSPGCWAAYGEVLAREYQDAMLFQSCHRLTVDAYALQHPGDPADRRAVQSVWLHLASLFVIYEKGGSFDDAGTLLKKLAGREFAAPGPVPEAFSVTVEDVLNCEQSGHAKMVQFWAKAAFTSWAHLHPQISQLISTV